MIKKDGFIYLKTDEYMELCNISRPTVTKRHKNNKIIYEKFFDEKLNRELNYIKLTEREYKEELKNKTNNLNKQEKESMNKEILSEHLVNELNKFKENLGHQFTENLKTIGMRLEKSTKCLVRN